MEKTEGIQRISFEEPATEYRPVKFTFQIVGLLHKICHMSVMSEVEYMFESFQIFQYNSSWCLLGCYAM